ncbi:MAG: hypothetical protein P8Y11_12180 [Gemmatimonadales bacterium]
MGNLPDKREITPPGLTHEQLERVIRRAAELQSRAGEAPEFELDEAEVVRIGEEVGLAPRHVRQALADLRAESLLPDLPEETSLAARLWGPGLVRESRVVMGDAADVEIKLDRYLRDRETLHPIRQRPGHSLWEKSGGLLSSLQRGLDLSGHGHELAKARNVEMFVEQLEPGHSLVTIVVDLRNQRTEHATGWFFALFPAVTAISAGIGVVLTGNLALVAAGAGVGATAGMVGSATLTSRSFHKRRARVALLVQGILDRLEAGRSLDSEEPSWRDRFLK